MADGLYHLLRSTQQNRSVLQQRAPLPHLGGADELAAPGEDLAVGGEILARSGKLVGSAQVRQRGALLQHGSILLGGSQEMIQAVSHQTSEVSGATNLSTVLGRPVTFDEVAEA